MLKGQEATGQKKVTKPAAWPMSYIATWHMFGIWMLEYIRHVQFDLTNMFIVPGSSHRKEAAPWDPPPMPSAIHPSAGRWSCLSGRKLWLTLLRSSNFLKQNKRIWCGKIAIWRSQIYRRFIYIYIYMHILYTIANDSVGGGNIALSTKLWYHQCMKTYSTKHALHMWRMAGMAINPPSAAEPVGRPVSLTKSTILLHH